jgi:hypothetical protein
VIFNHRFDSNVEKLDLIYKNRFSYIKYIMPFYDGSKENVIPVYDSSEVFQGYIAQAFSSFYNEQHTHHIFIADDLFLNSKINEDNILNILDLDTDTSYIKSILNLTEISFQEWSHAIKGIAAFTNTCYKNVYCNCTKELPSYQDAIELFKRHNLVGFDLTVDNFIYKEGNLSLKEKINKLFGIDKNRYRFKFDMMCNNRLFQTLYEEVKQKGKIAIPYPLAMGYSDFFVIPAKDIKRFSRLCGIFAAMRIFVEIAIPTAMVLSCKKIKYECDSLLKGIVMWDYPEPGVELYNRFRGYLIDLDKEMAAASNVLYYHPIKLSKWKS